jgi:O-acetyl-ADP-ribose deacetylase (regulator of RNase III)
MADMNGFADRVIDLAERFADVTDAALGKGVRKRTGIRWVVLPAAGAGLYALGASGSLTRQAKTVASQAKARASDLPDELLNRVQRATGTDDRKKNGRQPTQKAASRSTRKRRAKTSSSR